MNDKENLKELMGIKECQNQQSDGGTIEPFFASMCNLLISSALSFNLDLKIYRRHSRCNLREGGTSVVSEKEGIKSRSN
jgi:hypothetical protein